MPDITFRLPGREQYSYAEVTFSANELLTLNPSELQTTLQGALSDLDATYPQDAAPQAAPVQQAAPVAQQQPQQAAPAPGGQQCMHGPRKHFAGVSAKGPYQALFCPRPKGQDQCSPVWLKTGEPGWVWS
jgi:hypothetical protein